ncbi:HTTM domain-containing protein [Rhodopirellula sp. SWK7]|uniref:HTTM domain-containing protein n=1 Tax=Rhodopirellula sp. SWK7 TaxID=595460 RepID=UPI0002BD2EB6|nr:HTTM domain-containing protein [Rhodopirellula sp. SWK7]EMI42401.1 membrane protein containing HTTM domain protein [Rhodopirellula sp. SWK7]
MTSNTSLQQRLKNSASEFLDSWDEFWFAARHVETLAVLRIITGAMLLYSHVVLATNLESFLGVDAWINNDASRALHDGTLGEPTAAWSYLWNVDSPAMIGAHHFVTILVSASFMVGFLTRITGPLALWFQLMLIHRLLGSLFGLDQIVTYCAMYLAFAPCGAVFSLDAWLRRRFSAGSESTSKKFKWLFPSDAPSASANVATRLLQIHLCVIYLFGGLAKARGQLWWDGTAMWYAIGNYEYQSLDVTFLAAYPRFFTALTHVTLFWEVFYCALVWPRWTRPITLAIAVAVHGGIALGLGMATFGLMMIAANGIFVSPLLIRRWRGIEVPEPNMALAHVGIQPDASTANASIASRPEKVQKSTAAATEAQIAKRLTDLEKGEEAFRKRYHKLKRREAKVEERNERIKATKAKIRAKLEDGTLVRGDKLLDQSGIELSGIGLNDSHDDLETHIDDSLSGYDLLNPTERDDS